MTNRSESRGQQKGFLSRLAKDKRGNTFALIAAALFPLLGLLGGGIDMSRMYLTKTRLQHACDAGALAGRKAMGVNAWSTGTGSSEASALAMFDGNFQQGDYGTGTRTRAFSESDGTVTGTATSIVPMAVMKIFGMGSRNLTVTCSAKMAIPSTDVMFVLDMSGSMANNIPGDSTTKISGLKKAVKCFYEALVKVNTTAVCGNDPSATTYNGTAQIRFGFVPYSANVRVGRLLPTSYLADYWAYDSRTYSSSTGRWTYQPVTFNVSGLKNGSNWNTTVNLPIGAAGTNMAVTWDGCIEERSTYQISSNPPTNADFDPIPTTANDLNIDMLPSGSSTTVGSTSWKTYWGPMLDDAVYPRYQENCTTSRFGITTCSFDTNTPVLAATTPNNTPSTTSYSCPVASRTLQTYTTASPFESYVNSLASGGTTYHDIGMLWGARFISPTGMFASGAGNCTAAAANCTDNLTNIQRHVIFMTDGSMNACKVDYSAYGLNWWDRRQLSYAPVDRASATDTCGDGDVSRVNNARLQAICKAIKNMNITLWVISYGNGTMANLQSCATPGKYYDASSSSDLIAQFQQIASAISELRLTN